MCDAADLKMGDIVLEIGPGTGALTKELLAKGAVVVALEADLRAVESLNETFAVDITTGRLTIHHHDARTIDPTAFGLKDRQYKVIANIPYYISGLLFRIMLETDCQPNTLVFLVQKEVAARVARDKKESLLSLSVKCYGEPRYIDTINRGHFTPPPRVDSAIIAVRGISKTVFQNMSEKDFFILLHLGFGQKRKQLLSNLSKTYLRSELQVVFGEINIPLDVRAEDVSLGSWLDLAEMLLSPRISTT
jgi:16S rRNA (adenine1518-N6/adenine1519-N6)-dimethyltransferase